MCGRHFFECILDLVVLLICKIHTPNSLRHMFSTTTSTDTELNPGMCRLPVCLHMETLASLSSPDLMQHCPILHSHIKAVTAAETTNYQREI